MDTQPKRVRNGSTPLWPMSVPHQGGEAVSDSERITRLEKRVRELEAIVSQLMHERPAVKGVPFFNHLTAGVKQ